MSKLYFRYGAMNSGKSTNLMQVAYNYEERGMRVLLIKPSTDKKAYIQNTITMLWLSAHVETLSQLVQLKKN